MPHRILVVDDEPDLEPLVLQRFRKRIRSEELSFVFASHGEHALDQIREQGGIDIVLTDINMPVMDGLTLLGRLRSEHPMVRSVVVSAYGDMANIRTALNRGAFDFVTKPIDFQDLEITLDKAIDDSTLRKQAARDRDHLLGLGRELSVARSIQESLVPSVFPAHPRFEVFGSMTPAAEVGGDLFDFFLLEQNRLALAIGDISGKGIGAALFMAVSRTALRVSASKGLSTRECLNEVNRFLCEDKTNSLFLTCFYGILDLATGDLEYTRAGHNPPYVLRANPEANGGERVQETSGSGGLPLAMFDVATYHSARIRLEPGDCLVMFTDGVTEAMNAAQETYDEARLVALLEQQNRDTPVRELVQRVVGGAQEFAAGAPQSDDMTVLAIRYLGDNRP
ncbi:MAG: SpoIIE family protein phosphatase [Bryobacteraceae bacterium]